MGVVCDVVRRSTGPPAIASVDADGGPAITPIGTVFLRDDCTGFYFDQYAERLAENLDREPSSLCDGGRQWFGLLAPLVAVYRHRSVVEFRFNV